MNKRYYKTKRNHHEQQIKIAQKGLDMADSDEKEDYQKLVEHHEREYKNYARAYQSEVLAGK
jgi:hypothetical protein